MKKVIITGSKGVIGSVLMKGLDDLSLLGLDLPETDIRVLESLRSFESCDIVIHLAWNTKDENWNTGKIDPDNALMAWNIYEAALRHRVPRVIMASSVHADCYRTWQGPGLLKIDRNPIPTSPYGASKVFVEALGQYYATQGIEVICVRFGGVNPKNRPPQNDDRERVVWLSHKDCISLMRSCIFAEVIPNNFLIIYGVSKNIGRIHDIDNSLGWAPQESDRDFLNKA